MRAAQLWFTAPEAVEIRTADLPPPAPGQVLVATLCSAVSAGTELLLYRGEIPKTMALDTAIDGLQEQAEFPLQYGYACVGRVVQVGAGVDAAWSGRTVFAFQPHASHFVCTLDQLIEVPPDIPPERAVFLANMETAVNLVQDGAPLLGERVLVLGLGVVGLLLASLLAQFPLAELVAADAIAARREAALRLGVQRVFNPLAPDEITAERRKLAMAPRGGDLRGGGLRGCDLRGGDLRGGDLLYEVSGVPDALNLAIELSGYASRIVIGSWYGTKAAPVWLGGEAHRNRLQITTSQVSSIAAPLTARWTKDRRFATTWHMLRRVQPERWITQRLPLAEAAALYRQLHQQPQACLQALFLYPDS